MIFIPSNDSAFYFDEAAADRACRFIEKLLIHWEGIKFAGQPFILLDWERQIVRDLFGWRRVADGLRRFLEMYLLTAKGSGKTPLLAAIGMKMLLDDNEPGAHVISSATDFPQAYLTLDAAKKFIAANDQLGRLCDPKQFEIRVPRTNSKWTVVSGTAEGKHGFRPTCLLMDEAHEWPNGLLYNNLTANTTKRAQPLTIVATNAGVNRSCFAWQLHERAVKMLNGKTGASGTLYPVIFEAPESMDWTSEEAARAANPSLGLVTTFDQLAPELEKAKESPDAEHRYRRLYLSQWQKTGAGRWLSMDEWDACESTDEAPAGSPLYVGMDLAESDDLCAVAFISVDQERFYLASHFWLPKLTAFMYEEKHGIPYKSWSEAGHITLIDEPTISPAVRKRIAAAIIARGKTRPIKAVCYDRYKADITVAELESAGIACVPVPQGYSVSPGCFEFERRMKEQSVAIFPNPVLRFCAENAETKSDDRGNKWVAKPGAKGKFAGEKARKVDGITATVTAMTEARKHTFPAGMKMWTGEVSIA